MCLLLIRKGGYFLFGRCEGDIFINYASNRIFRCQQFEMKCIHDKVYSQWYFLKEHTSISLEILVICLDFPFPFRFDSSIFVFPSVYSSMPPIQPTPLPPPRERFHLFTPDENDLSPRRTWIANAYLTKILFYF